MARARLDAVESDDIMSDGGKKLFSIAQGEQLEFPITLNFLDSVEGYSFDAAAVEALNVAGQTEQPVAIEPAGLKTLLSVRVPVDRGAWGAAEAYTQGQFVLHEGIYYHLQYGVNRVSSTEPADDPLWIVTKPNNVYVQIPAALGSTYSVQPTVGSPIYAFLELKVQEPVDALYQRTWKPVRGVIEMLFSPVDVV